MENHNMPPVWERSVGLIGLILLCGVLAYLSWLTLTQETGPPRIVFEVTNIKNLQPGFVAQIKVTNTGQQTAAALKVEGQLESPDGQMEKVEGTLDYLPSSSSRQIGLFFDGDPQAGRLTLRALSYQQP